ncbi:MAG: hypothetical protein DRR19_23135 [Candidatus Parabeggiatoa sp. nov. 1]|nr:MAG: hypothetical protein DRR19_23135 [Gammaproteobacteria bacterium]
MVFKVICLLVSALLVLVSCVPTNSNIVSTGGGTADVSCTKLINLYNEPDYYTYTLKGPKAYEKPIKLAFLKEQGLLFSQVLMNTTKVDFKYIDQFCIELDTILKNENIVKKQQELSYFRKKLRASYNQKLSKSEIRYRTIEGCDKFASRYVKSILAMTVDTYRSHTVEKNQYLRCIDIHEKRGK